MVREIPPSLSRTTLEQNLSRPAHTPLPAPHFPPAGFFMPHSVPDFPNYVSDGYLYGSSQEKYGQTLTCFNVDAPSIDKLAYAMLCVTSCPSWL